MGCSLASFWGSSLRWERSSPYAGIDDPASLWNLTLIPMVFTTLTTHFFAAMWGIIRTTTIPFPLSILSLHIREFPLHFASLETWLYGVQQVADGWVNQQLLHLTPVSVGILILAGLMTSLTPCMLSMLPITLSYLGGYDSKTPGQSLVQALWFALGLASTLAALGVVATLIGQVYGQVGWPVSLVVSAVAIVMGLNLLEIVPLQFPSMAGIPWLERPNVPPPIRAYGLGLTFGLVASPCSTPVLATLLTWISTVHNPWLGGGLLLAYGLGYVSPLVMAGAMVGRVKQLLALRQWSGWINPTSGVVLLIFGVVSLLNRVIPEIWPG